MNNTARINIKLPIETKDIFKELAEKNGTTVSMLMREWIERYVRNNTQVSSFEKLKDSDPELYAQYLEAKQKSAIGSS